jgi:hypothetical protein
MSVKLLTSRRPPSTNTAALETQINQLVYQLYDLKKEEID